MFNQKGTTLLEILIYIAITAIILFVVGESVSLIVFSQQRIKNEKEIAQNLILAVAKTEKSIKEASAVTGTYPADVLNLTIEGATTTYSISGGVLQKKVGEASPVDITTDKITISSWEGEKIFSLISTDTIQIKFKIVSCANTDVQSQNQTTVSLRKSW
jgi:type II secretory pathway pseudopilin PulG